MKIEVLEADGLLWRGVLETLPHDFYSLPGYAALESERLDGRALALLGRDDGGSVLLPAVVRDLPRELCGPETVGLRDAVSPYGYPGISVAAAKGREAALVEDFLCAARPVLADLGVINVFLRLNPVIDEAEWFAGGGTLVQHGETVWIDLTLSEDELHRQTRSRFRGNINAARRDGLRVVLDSTWSRVEVFTKMYHDTMRSVGAEDWYLFPEEYFLRLHEVAGAAVHLFLVESDAGVAAAGLFSECDGIVQYLFSGRDESDGHPHGTKLMMAHVRDWAKSRGNRVMHLGGGLGARTDNLSQFKRGFSKLTRPFHTWRWVVDAELHQQAMHSWQQATGLTDEGESGYFPGYRQVRGEPRQQPGARSERNG